MSDIKIFVSCHKKSYVPKNAYLIPIQVGAALSKERFEGYVHDDEGDNISEKNKSYCELTAQYWAWKNCEADYYGFFHYRRYMSFSNEQIGDIETYHKYPYCTNEVIEDIELNEEKMKKVITNYDVLTIIPTTLDNYTTVRGQYAMHDVHFIEDLDECCLDIVKKKYPEIFKTAVDYLNGGKCYYCNMYIASREIFYKYSEFLFNILNEFEKTKDVTLYNPAQYRVYGYLGERLWGIYYTYLKKIVGIRYKELQRIEFSNTDTTEFAIQSVENTVNVVLSTSDYYVPYATVMLVSLAKNASPQRKYNIIVFNLGLSVPSQAVILNNLTAYSNISVNFVNLTPLILNYPIKGKGYVSMHSWLRILTPYALKKLNKVIYLDSDMVINHDISELYDIDVNDVYLAATRDYRVIGSGIYFPKRKIYSENELEIKNIYNYFQAGVLVLNLDKFRENYTLNSLMELCYSREWELLDQDFLNSILQDRYKIIDSKWDVVADWNNRCKAWIESLPHALYDDFMAAYSEPYIIHYGGPYKPWSNPSIDFCDIFWHYARQSTQADFIILRAMVEKDASLEKRLSRMKIPTKKSHTALPPEVASLNEKKLLNRLFPRDSLRRKIIKKIFSCNNKAYNILRERYGI